MSNSQQSNGHLFNEDDFALFDKYKGKTQKEAPEGQQPLRELYDKLGMIVEGLTKLNYHCEIKRNPLKQGGPGTMKYADYHWSRIYPQDKELYKGCLDKVFVVVGTTNAGLDIHIDCYSLRGLGDNDVSNVIKENTWLTLSPQEASKYSCDELVAKVDDYFKSYWKQFCLYGKEFGIVECINELNKMDINSIKELLKSNHNIVLTGAPGTGKTYLAKEIAKAMDAEYKVVQFHPSYDYTDFVEGLRPIKEGSTLGFQRKDGVFKTFCKEALNFQIDSLFDHAYNALIDNIKKGSIKTIKLKTKESAELDIRGNDSIGWYSETEKNNKSSNVVSKDRMKKLFNVYNTLEKLKELQNINESIQSIIGGCDSSYYWGVLNYLLENNSFQSKPYVFIIDEINRGEISKIFGELFYSIDAGYRGESGKVDTQYQNLIPKEGDDEFDPADADVFRNGFFVPDNVYIIGTMNDIDRSVESMDFAMRRRFAWKEITAESRQSMLDDEKAWKGNKPNQQTIDEIKERMNNLNACIIDTYGDKELAPKDRIGLNRAYQIGASYFLKYRLYGNFEDLWSNHLEGLLYEYLRGTTNIESKIERLHKAYNNE